MLNKLSSVNFALPSPVVLLGSMQGEQVNFMTAAWVTRANILPPMYAVCIGRYQHSAVGILDKKAFSLTVPSKKMMGTVDYCGMVSGSDVDKSSFFNTFAGEQTGMPIVADAPLSLECTLYQSVELPSHYAFFGEVKTVWCDGTCMTDGEVDPEKLDMYFLSLPDERYWGLGACAGKAWDLGNKDFGVDTPAVSLDVWASMRLEGLQ